MAMKRWMISFVILAACLAGCVPSLHELYTKDTLVYDPSLVGTWVEEKAIWQFTGDPNTKAYQLVITEQDEKRGSLESKLEAHLVELDGKRYLDLFPQKDVELNVGDWFRTNLLRAHTFLKTEIKNGKLLLSVMDLDTVEKMIEKNPGLVKHEKTEDRIVLTASPKELQEFIKKNAAAEKFFGEPVELKRRGNESATK